MKFPHEEGQVTGADEREIFVPSEGLSAVLHLQEIKRHILFDEPWSEDWYGALEVVSQAQRTVWDER